MKRVTILCAILLVALLIAGCSDQSAPTALSESTTAVPTSLAKATTSTVNFTFPVNFSVFVPCAVGGAGEVIQVSGTVHAIIHETINGNNFQSAMNFNPQGVIGVGLTTGDKYQGGGVTHIQSGGSFVNGQSTFTVVNIFDFNGPGPGNNFTLHETAHVTFNADGTLTAFVDNETLECK